MSNSIYKKDTKGKIRVYRAFSEGSMLIQESGIVDGKITRRSSECKPKNVGRANATTAEEQASKEAKAKLINKMSEGYFKTKEAAEFYTVVLPMLAKEYGKESHKIDWDGDVFIQPKLDGMRALCRKYSFSSRKGNRIDTMDHITDDLSGIDYVLDGELYAHGKSFQENMKLIKKYRPGESETVKFHVYDILARGNFKRRLGILQSVIDNIVIERGICSIKLVPTYPIKSESDMHKYHQKFLDEGYEGSIVRHGDDEYKINGRSSSLLKVKDFIDVDAEITDITPNEKDPTHGTPHLIYNGKVFKAGVKMSHEQRVELLSNKDDYIGKKANIRFFEYTDDGIPRFPIMVGVHEDR